MAVRSSNATWRGKLNDGEGTMKLGSGLYEGPYTFASRFKEGEGTNPEELIGAAHAGCYSMFLSALLGKAEYTPVRVHTSATVTLSDGPTISSIELVCEAEVSGGISEEEFLKLAEDAKAGCPVSKALASVETISLKATLV